MRAAVVPDSDGGLEIRERPVPDPGPGEVRVRVEACGVCGGDDVVVDGTPGVDYPRVPGHELVGVVDAVGRDVTDWRVDDRVGVGWHGGHCFACEACRHGEFLHCDEKPITGVHRDGGYAEYALARTEALAAVPDALEAVDAAPLLCAGLTTFNALRHADVGAGDLVAVLGVGGLGHLAVQYAHEAGFRTVAVSRGDAKHAAARDLGADHYVDAHATDPGEELQALGGADLVLSTAPVADAVAPVVDGLAAGGDLCNVGVPDDPVPVDVGRLVDARASVSGWASGTPIDAEETLAFSERRAVRPRVETYDLEDAPTAYRRMTDGDVRFRAVLTP
ncbi:alcohol dehydrogenase catalytic domain-containing protein [Halorubellus sp. JP-L1]|uniref:alcohol dehydrogenase catalytic domain-containing protein n=1 Tax=Halorubellus sp. JP-L1 TaxID=2715753 RepID=UPI00140ACFE7|nr:alcohol dehydrogenase catalytic domain-containing protein [Halorubellus sp. JP-L1]NHN40126.1 alcohol dehydrogenase catalytic domain-containing protein [Halorubellus sp. JP-L1]